ncbi:MAG: branched-chain amino acid ABC transporter permease [Anaerolineaceae bacterium]|nr:branched-chain amino acid ABC transporter permease [Anaerolineaceae bacterium]
MKKKLVASLGILASVILLFLINRFQWIGAYYLQIIQYIGIYAIMVLGINLVNGYLGIFSLGHAGIMAIGAYASALLSKYVMTDPAFFPVCILFGGMFSSLASFLISIPSFKVRGDYLAIITLGFTLIMRSALQNFEFVGGSRGLRNIPANTNVVWVFIFLVLAIFLVIQFMNSKYGRSVLAIHEDEIAAELMSVDVKKTKMIVFAFSSFLIGISGGLLSHLLSYTNPNTFGYSMVSEGLIMVYLGGIGSISGSILGAVVWTLLVEILRPLGVWRWIIGAILLIVVMIYRPRGIAGRKEFGSSQSEGPLAKFWKKIQKQKNAETTK